LRGQKLNELVQRGSLKKKLKLESLTDSGVELYVASNDAY